MFFNVSLKSSKPFTPKNVEANNQFSAATSLEHYWDLREKGFRPLTSPTDTVYYY